jgi:hypothetical protein
MSHNKIKVAGQEPNASGDITLSLDNLSDVNTAGVQANQTLIYNGSSYVAGNKEGVLGVVFLTSNNTSSNYPQTLNAADNVYWYAPTPINTIIGASLLDSDSLGSNWYDGVTLPAGDYIIQCSLHGDFTGSTGQCKFVLKAGLTAIGCIAESADPSNNSEYPNDASAYFSSSSSFDLTADMLTLTAANSTTTDLQAKRGYLYIWKVA